MKVDLPQPDGPMMAVTALGAIVRSIPLQDLGLAEPRVEVLDVDPVRHGHLIEPPTRPPGGEPSGQAGDEHHRDQHERRGPRLPVPVVVGRDGVRVDLQRQRGDGLVQALVPEAIAERREEQRRRLAGDPGDRHHHAGDDAGPRGGQDDPQRSSSTRGGPGPSPASRRLSGTSRTISSVVRSTMGSMMIAEREPAGERREAAHGQHDQGVGEDADHDRGHAVQHVGEEAHEPRQAAVPGLGEVDAAEDPERQAEADGEADHDEAADDRVARCRRPARRPASAGG